MSIQLARYVATDFASFIQRGRRSLARRSVGFDQKRTITLHISSSLRACMYKARHACLHACTHTGSTTNHACTHAECIYILLLPMPCMYNRTYVLTVVSHRVDAWHAHASLRACIACKRLACCTHSGMALIFHRIHAIMS